MSHDTPTATTFDVHDWDRYARSYDALLHLNPYVTMLNDVAHEIMSGPNGLMLDASCGTGNLEMVLSELGQCNVQHIIGVDIAQPMLERARIKCMSHAQYTFRTTDLNARLPFADNRFAQIASINTLYAVHDPSATLQEFHRVLAQGGQLAIVTPSEGYENGMILKQHCMSTLPDSFWKDMHASAEREEELIRHAITDARVISDMLTVAHVNRIIACNTAFHFHSAETWVRILETAGFRIQRISRTYADQDILIIAQKGSVSCTH